MRAIKETILELYEIGGKLNAMVETDQVDLNELDRIARQDIERLALTLKDLAYEAKRGQL